MVRRWIWNVLIVGFVLFSLSPTLYELGRAGDLHKDRQFELVHNFPTDYNFYLSRIREGLEGRWTSVERYTSEPHEGSFIHEMYVLMGRVGMWVRVPWHRAGDIYHVARVVLAVTLLALMAAFCKQTFAGIRFGNTFFNDAQSSQSTLKRNSHASLSERSHRENGFQKLGRTFSALQNDFLHEYSLSTIAFLLVVTASSWSKLVYVDGIARFGGYMPWWSVMDSLQRITFIPHLLAGQALIICLLLGLTRIEIMKKSGNVVFLGLLGLLLGMIFPPGLFFVYCVMAVYALLQGKEMGKYIIPFLLVFLISMPALVYLGLMTQVYPWKRLVEVDIIRPLPFDYLEYIKAIGPMGPVGLIGLIWVLVRKEKVMFLSVAWVISWVGLLFGFHFVPQQSPLRFSEMIPHVPLGVLTAYLFYRIGHFRKSRIMYHVSFVIPIVLILMGFLHMYSSFLWQKDFIDHKIRATTPLVPTGSYVMYPLKDFITAIVFIQDHTERDAVVLSASTAGNYIPVYSGNRVYLGHDNTVFFEQKKEMAAQFFSGRMAVHDAAVWIKRNAIRMVFYGPQEKEEGGGNDLHTTYPFLVRQFSNAFISVYSVEE